VVTVLTVICHPTPGSFVHALARRAGDVLAAGGADVAGWMDRVIVPGVAYRLDRREGLPTSLLQLRGMLVLNTGDTPPEREREVFGDPLDAIWRRCVGAYLGPGPVHRLLAGPMGGSTPEQRRAWLDRAGDLAAAMAPAGGR